MNEKFKTVIWDFVHKTQGTDLPIQYIGRLEDELAAIPGTGFLDDLALVTLLKDAADKDGCEIEVDLTYGSSLLNWLWRTSSTDPLPPHYYCRECGRTEFIPEAKDGLDLPGKDCCGVPMVRSGHLIPFESMLPHIDERGMHLGIKLPGSFSPTALRVLGEYFEKQGEYRPIVIAADRDDPDPCPCIRFALIPIDDPMPELQDDDTWKADPHFLYVEKNYRTITLALSDKKELLKEKAAQFGDTPTADDLGDPQVLEAVQILIESRLNEENRRILRIGNLCFSSLLAMHGYERSVYTDENPVLSDPEASYEDLFTTRESVWDLLMNATKPEYRIGTGFASKVTRFTRSGRFTDNRMPQETERLLHEMGIPDHWITQMKTTGYLPPKADVINTLMDDLKLAWYELKE